MNIFASITISFIPLVAVYVCFLLLEPEFNKLDGIKACLYGLLALIPIELILTLIYNCYPFNQQTLFGRLLKGLLINGIIEEIR